MSTRPRALVVAAGPCPSRTRGVARPAVHDLAGRAIIDANPEPVTVEASPTRS